MDHHEPVVALKEWAVALEAMGEGNQILLLRKGGIREAFTCFPPMSIKRKR